MSLQITGLIGRDFLTRFLKCVVVAGPLLSAPRVALHGYLRALRLDGFSIKARVQTRAVELLLSQALLVHVRRATQQHRHDPQHHTLHSTT